MREAAIESSDRQLEERVIDIWRCACVVKGGRRFSFAAMAVVGDGDGRAGMGYGKAREVPAAIEKAVKDAKKHMERFVIVNGTIPHETRGNFGSASVLLIPAMPGTGVIAGEAVRAVAEALGVKNLLSKSFGRNNAKNLVRATFDAFRKLRTYEQIRELRGVEMEYRQIKADRGSASPAAVHGSGEDAAASSPAEESAGERRGRRSPEGRGPRGGRWRKGPREQKGMGEKREQPGDAGMQTSGAGMNGEEPQSGARGPEEHSPEGGKA